jgi:hypothetical protein
VSPELAKVCPRRPERHISEGRGVERSGSCGLTLAEEGTLKLHICRGQVMNACCSSMMGPLLR